MGFFTNLLNNLPLYILTIPVVLMALSFHESAHGYVALKLGDPTARNFGRITLNPAKHIDPLGFICMLLFHVGWAKPVPVNTRNFEKPRRDMALTGAAGPISNLILAIIHFIILRISIIFITKSYGEEAALFRLASYAGEAFKPTLGFAIVSLVVYILFIGIVLNISLAIFNLIPVPPFDGSRIFYAFLPPKWYFGVMKYERVIMIVFLFLFMFGFLSGPLATFQNFIVNGMFRITGMNGTEEMGMLNTLINYVQQMLTSFF